MSFNSIHYKFYFNRKNMKMEIFLDGVNTLDGAISKFDSLGLYGYDIDEIISCIDRKKSVLKSSSKDDLKKDTPKKKPAASKSNSSKNKKTRTRRRQPKKTAKENSGEEKQDDSSYFETWKVPYVEP